VTSLTLCLWEKSHGGSEDDPGPGALPQVETRKAGQPGCWFKISVPSVTWESRSCSWGRDKASATRMDRKAQKACQRGPNTRYGV